MELQLLRIYAIIIANIRNIIANIRNSIANRRNAIANIRNSIAYIRNIIAYIHNKFIFSVKPMGFRRLHHDISVRRNKKNPG